MNNFYKFKHLRMYNVLTIFLLLFVGLHGSESLNNSKKQHEIRNLIDRCRKRIKEFPYLNDPIGDLTIEEARQLSYDEKRKLSDEALAAYLYYADIR